MKKKLAIFASLVLIFSVAAAGTYAYLTAQGMAHNVITAGNINITLHDEGKQGETWDDFNKLYPTGASVMPGVTVDKRVYVENTGKNPCYVRVKLTPSAVDAGGSPLATDGQFQLDLASYAQYWTMDSEGFYRYNTMLQPGDKTEMLISSVTFDTKMGNTYMNSRFDILVDAQAVQGQNNTFDTAVGETVLDVKGWPAAPAPTETPADTGSPAVTETPAVTEAPVESPVAPPAESVEPDPVNT